MSYLMLSMHDVLTQS